MNAGTTDYTNLTMIVAKLTGVLQLTRTRALHKNNALE
jgi:hypothetical protein